MKTFRCSNCDLEFSLTDETMERHAIRADTDQHGDEDQVTTFWFIWEGSDSVLVCPACMEPHLHLLPEGRSL